MGHNSRSNVGQIPHMHGKSEYSSAQWFKSRQLKHTLRKKNCTYFVNVGRWDRKGLNNFLLNTSIQDVKNLIFMITNQLHYDNVFKMEKKYLIQNEILLND